jgi:hypothetical protein
MLFLVVEGGFHSSIVEYCDAIGRPESTVKGMPFMATGMILFRTVHPQLLQPTLHFNAGNKDTRNFGESTARC